MKYSKIFALAVLFLVAKSAFAQVYTGSVYRSRVADSTTVNMPTGYGGLYYQSQTGRILLKDGTGWFDPRTAGSVSDGNKKDITVRNSGANWFNNTMWKSYVRLKTTSALSANAYTTPGGVPTITSTDGGANPIDLEIDGIEPDNGDAVIVSEESTGFHNGVYIVISNGQSPLVPWKLELRGDSRTAEQINNAIYYVYDGTDNIDKYFRQDVLQFGSISEVNYTEWVVCGSSDPYAFIKRNDSTLVGKAAFGNVDSSPQFVTRVVVQDSANTYFKAVARDDDPATVQPDSAWVAVSQQVIDEPFTGIVKSRLSEIGSLGVAGTSKLYSRSGASGIDAGDIVFQITEDDATLQDNRATKKGIVNAADYSADFVNESLITKRYADAKIATTITDGVTTSAPNQNAVFDALAAKQPLDAGLTTLAGLDVVGNAGKKIEIDGSGNYVASTQLAQPATTNGDFIQYNGTAFEKLAAVSANSFMRSTGVGGLNAWSTLKLPNAATSGRIPYATSTDTWGETAEMSYSGNGVVSLGSSTSGGSGFTTTFNTTGGGGSFRGVAGSTNIGQLGFNTQNQYGGTSNTTSGRNLHYYDLQASAYRWGIGTDGTMYVGPSSTNFGFASTISGTIVVGATSSAGQIRIGEIVSNGVNYRGFTVPNSMSANALFELPALPTVNDQILVGSTAGVLSFATGDLALNSVSVGRGGGSIATNTRIGTSALAANTTGSLNVAVGYQALQNATDNVNNTAVGVNALNALAGSSAGNNTAVGYHAGQTITTGQFNTDVGSDNSSSGNFVTTGSYNIRLGYTSGSNVGVTTGSGNILIGSNFTGLSSSLSNNVMIAPGSGGVSKLTYDGTNWSIVNNAVSMQLGNLSGSVSQVGAATTTFTVTIGTTMSNSSYKTQVTPTASLSAAPFYVSNKTTTTFDVVYLSGLTGTVTFDWLVTP